MNKPSLRKAINAYCKGCIYDRAEVGAWREQVTRCPVKNCELWHVRPLTSKIQPEE